MAQTTFVFERARTRKRKLLGTKAEEADIFFRMWQKLCVVILPEAKY